MLATKKISRSQLMVSFSEASEGVQLLQGAMTTVDTFDAMLGRAATSAELAYWRHTNPNVDHDWGSVGIFLLTTAGYAADH